MHPQPTLDLNDAARALQASRAHADSHQGLVSIAVVDGGGHLLAFQRLDGASISSAETAIAKARMAALCGKPTAEMEASINGPRPGLLQLAGLLQQPSAAMAGGLPLLIGSSCIGAIGVSGMTPELDAAIASAGLQALHSQP
jgi:glc operon protein GlcG